MTLEDIPAADCSLQGPLPSCECVEVPSGVGPKRGDEDAKRCATSAVVSRAPSVATLNDPERDNLSGVDSSCVAVGGFDCQCATRLGHGVAADRRRRAVGSVSGFDEGG